MLCPTSDRSDESAACWMFAVQPIGTNYWACEFIANLVNPFGADLHGPVFLLWILFMIRTDPSTMGIDSIMISNLAHGDDQSLLGAVFQTSIQLSGTIGVCLSSLVSKLVFDKSEDLHHA